MSFTWSNLLWCSCLALNYINLIKWDSIFINDAQLICCIYCDCGTTDIQYGACMKLLTPEFMQHASHVPCSVLTTDVFLCWQAWLWPMWTPACLPTRPPLLLSVSESTYWTWFPPVQSPRQPTHGNDAFLLPTDTITITLPHINNSHSHYHASPFYGLFACGQNGAGGNQPHFLWAGDVPPLLS